jgi:hypothetical protein
MVLIRIGLNHSLEILIKLSNMRKLKMSRTLFLIFFLSITIFLNFDLSAQKNVIGKYIGAETNRTLTINQDGSYFLLNEKHGVILYHIDTLSYGKWKQDGVFIILNTPKSIESRSLRVNVIEKYIPNIDTLKIEISNPYEDYFQKYGGKRLFEYVFFIDSYEAKFGPEIFMKGNKISLYKTENDKIVSLNITIVPVCYLYPSPLAFNYLVSDTYTFKNRNSNYIKVNIPDFKFEYIGYERYKEEYLRIRKNGLILRGEVFERQDK